MPKLKPHAREKRKTAGVRSQSGGWKGRTMNFQEMICGDDDTVQ